MIIIIITQDNNSNSRRGIDSKRNNNSENKNQRRAQPGEQPRGTSSVSADDLRWRRGGGEGPADIYIFH